MIGNKVTCPKCSTPWISGLNSYKLLPAPRKTKQITRLLRKEKNSEKLSLKARELLKLFKNNKNTLQITCHVCKYKLKEVYKKPEKEKEAVKIEEKEDSSSEELTTSSKKKRKKRKNKEINAGLKIIKMETSNDTPVKERKQNVNNDSKVTKIEITKPKNENKSQVNCPSTSSPASALKKQQKIIDMKKALLISAKKTGSKDKKLSPFQDLFDTFV